MNAKSANIITDKLAGWSPSAESQLVIFWRVMHMYMHRYGSIPLGQMLVELTTTVLNELGRPPTVTDLCDTTGLPKSSISRYISAQMNQNMIEELIDPDDRRRRKLVLTDKGRAERSWQIREIRKIFESACEWDRRRIANGGKIDADVELALMKRVNEDPPEHVGRKRKKRGEPTPA
jgi:DNA-binding MarR family transcriptional regulator